MQRPRLAVLAASLLALLFVAGVVAAPLLERGGHAAAGWLRLVYAPLCHQQPDRSPALAGSPLAVCARCFGLYVGGTIGLLAAGLLVAGRERRLPPLWLALAVGPSVLDVLLPWIGLPGLPNVTRLVLALPAGLVAGLFLAHGLADLFAAPDRKSERAVCAVHSLEVTDG